jgi:pimeloyl-ACP methyl ester carboxylesterase
LSSKPDAYKILQTPLQSEVIKELTILSTSGDLLKVSNKTGGDKTLTYQPSTIVHVGHSYGSIATNLFLTTYPNMSDAALLTGFLISPKAASLKLEAGDFAYAAQLDPVRFADRGSGYMAFGTLSSFQLDSLRKATFEPDVLLYYNETKETVAVGELLSLTVGVGAPVKGFRGPVQVSKQPIFCEMKKWFANKSMQALCGRIRLPFLCWRL